MRWKKWILLFCAFAIAVSAFAETQPRPTNEPSVIVVFGATGTLTARKILPAIFNLSLEGELSHHTAIVGVGRRPYDNAHFRREMREAVDIYSRSKPIDPAAWEEFEQKLFYHQADFDQQKGFDTLGPFLSKLDREFGTKGNRLYYLATQPSQFSPIVEQLQNHKLLYPSGDASWSRVMVEKPFGRDLDSAVKLHDQLSKILDEDQIYRIDHFLGKQGVQNLFALRFEDGFFEPLWNRHHIDRVEITISETVGIGTRGHFWEETGLLRDMFQNHMMQLLALTAMEPPQSHDAQDVHSEKVKLLNALHPISPDQIDQIVVRGQYAPNKKMLGYRQEKDIPSHSDVETFMAAKVFIDNERWQGVPFYLRAGKRLPQPLTEIAVVFKNQLGQKTHTLFIRIQPEPGVYLQTISKTPSLTGDTVASFLSTRLDASAAPEAYEKLIYDAIRGDASLFVDTEEHLAAWRWLAPILDHWKSHPPPFPNYAAGSWGPEQNLLPPSNKDWASSTALNSSAK